MTSRNDWGDEPPRRSQRGLERGDSPPMSRGSRAHVLSPAGPPVFSLAALVVVVAFTVVAFWLGHRASIGILDTGRSVDFNTLGYVVGCFVSIVALFRFLRADQRARDTRMYQSWRFGNARRIALWLAVSSWTLGAVHLLFWARDLTRP